MAERGFSLRCVLLRSLLISGAVAAPSPSASSSSVGQVTTTVPQKPAAGAPLHDSERIQLSDGRVKSVSAEDAAVFGSLDSTENNKLASERAAKLSCKVFPGDRDWPSEKLWRSLDGFLGADGKSTARKLIPTVPIAAPCYDTEWGKKDPATCANIAGNFTNAALHYNHPTSTMWPIFQGRTCMPKNNTDGLTCTLGGYPEYAIKVTSVADIQLGINFARTTGVRLVIKNTGHCYLGKSNGAGALSLWMHNLKEINFLPNYKGPGYSGPALKLAAGVRVREVYEAADKYGVTVTGAISPSVGYAGGMITGGGQNPLAAIYGMAADQVMAFNVVTADGRFITVSKESNSDLFWALRGGGGGTFAVVVSVIIRAYPKMKAVTSNWQLTVADNGEEKYWAAVKKLYELWTDWTDANLYTFFLHNHLFLDMQHVFAPNHTLETYNKAVKPFFDYLSENDIKLTKPHNSTAHTSFYSAYQATWGSNPPFIGTDDNLPANRLVPRRNFEEKFNETYDFIRNGLAGAGRIYLGYHNAPKSYADIDNAVHPAWRECVFFFVTLSNRTMDHSNPEGLKAANADLQKNVLDPWRKLTPVSEGGGTYLNEATVEEPDWQESFYGGYYPRLSEIKRKYDPLDVFYATTAVGSERWEVRDGDQGVQTQNGRLCKV